MSTEFSLKFARNWAAREPDAVAMVDVPIAAAGLTIDAVMAQTLAVNIREVESIDRMVAGAEARRNVALREIDWHRSALGAARANARASSGPKTVAGKAQSAQNAFRHGFNVPICLDPALASDVEALAQRIAGKDADASSMSWSRRDASPRRKSICAACASTGIF